MSRFLDVPNRMKIATPLHNAALYYVFPVLDLETPTFILTYDYSRGYKAGKEKEFVQLMINHSNHKLRMYGSAQELLENINVYESFPGNDMCFGTPTDVFQTRPKIFTSLNNEKYIAKSDLFVVLQNIYFSLRHGGPILSLVSLYLKSKQENIGKCTEFVKFDENRFEQIQKKMYEEFLKRKLSPAEDQKTLREFSKLSQTEIIKKFKALCPSTFNEHQKESFDNVVERFINACKNVIPTEQIAWCYSRCDIFISVLDIIINENLSMFSPRSKNSKEPITLRVFEDGDQRFLMKSEVSDALIANATLSKRLDDEDDENTFHTITLKEVLKNFDTKNIEFIRYPILRAKHRATPVPAPTAEKHSETCILSIDAFFEFFNELLLCSKYFQKADSNLQDVLNVLKNAFKLDSSTPCFHRISIYPTLSTIEFRRCNTTYALFGGFLSQLAKVPAKNVRNAEKDGFTVQILKKELASLGLTKKFPEIQNYAVTVYSEVNKRKKEKVLRTCDMFDAVEHCQLNCILERLPELKKFVHNQKGCHRVYGLKCKDCAAESSETQKDQKLSILEKELADLKIAYQKVLEENLKKSLENQELQHKNLRLSVKNETNEIKMKQLTDKLTKSKLSIGDENYSNPCTSPNTSQLKIQCLICEKSIESGEDQIIRCPLCKRRFHSKCAINWLKEHKECPACNGDLPKI
ncbi:hypothetical protein B9Z55_004343 [Caenorhabditis nigoni]|uniref:RING-type domain-containing protein n=1 Tax=Caenorhabditis nigoni TaxID=1611254 RepID=A0A2G5UWF6_9PELO|nr:hypothetical protein B9Z55_004343 [Caenorhabditis nigoni]